MSVVEPRQQREQRSISAVAGPRNFVRDPAKHLLRSLRSRCAILAGDQWWPRTSGGRLRFAHAISHLLRHRFGLFIKGNNRDTYKERLTKFSALEAKDKQFYRPTLIPTPLQSRGMTIFQTQIIKYRNKHVQIAVLIFFYHEKL